jgi:hypothetical protein
VLVVDDDIVGFVGESDRRYRSNHLQTMDGMGGCDERGGEREMVMGDVLTGWTTGKKPTKIGVENEEVMPVWRRSFEPVLFSDVT